MQKAEIVDETLFYKADLSALFVCLFAYMSRYL